MSFAAILNSPKAIAISAYIVEVGLAIGAVLNLIQAPTPTRTGSDAEVVAELVTWLVRGSISGVMLLVVWLLKESVRYVREMRAEQMRDQRRLDHVEYHLAATSDFEPRRENLGVRARRPMADGEQRRSGEMRQ